MITSTSFPGFTRTRRTRRTAGLRSLVRETRIDPGRLIYPLFVQHGSETRQAITSMPGQDRISLDLLAGEAAELRALGIGAVLLFGIPASKDPAGSEGYATDGIVAEAIRTLKAADPGLVVIADVCLCEYTDHGHCGVLTVTGEVDNDPTLDLLARMAVTLAGAGADIIAPSDMMDGRVGAIRSALDSAGFSQTPILSYSAKFASAFYGPFREAAGSTPAFGDRRSYQMDPANVREALREVAADEAERADLVMVKPALSYLDVIRAVRERTDLPLVAYNVSGEYAMVKAAAQQGWLDEQRIVLEILTSIFRAGADAVITYHAKDAARWLAEGDG